LASCAGHLMEAKAAVPDKFHPICSKGVYDCVSCPAEKFCSHQIYFCRDDLTCPDYSFFNITCVRGGGVGCAKWRRHSNKMIADSVRERVPYNSMRRITSGEV
jgi:hypothetical protein